MLRRLLMNQRHHVGQVGVFPADLKAAMHRMDLPVAPDQDRRRHVLEVELFGDIAPGIIENVELSPAGRQKIVGLCTVTVEIDSQYHQPVGAIGRLYLVHPGEGEMTWRTPGRPEIEIHNLSTVRREVKAGCVNGRGGAQKQQ
jgi:hypothetical protein